MLVNFSSHPGKFCSSIFLPLNSACITIEISNSCITEEISNHRFTYRLWMYFRSFFILGLHGGHRIGGDGQFVIEGSAGIHVYFLIKTFSVLRSGLPFCSVQHKDLYPPLDSLHMPHKIMWCSSNYCLCIYNFDNLKWTVVVEEY
jgi:hypothetical protein